jgi:arylsulfatase
MVKAPPRGRNERTMPFAYSGDEGEDVGMDNETPVAKEYAEGDNRFTGRIHKRDSCN